MYRQKYIHVSFTGIHVGFVSRERGGNDYEEHVSHSERPRKRSGQVFVVLFYPLHLRRSANAALYMLHKPRDELELPATFCLGAFEFLVIVCRGVEMSVKRTQGCELVGADWTHI